MGSGRQSGIPPIKILEGVQLLVMSRPRVQSWSGWSKRARGQDHWRQEGHEAERSRY